MEEKIILPISDNHELYGILNFREKSSKVIIFVHGLTGSQNEHHYFNAVPYFTSRGFDTFRFDFYSKGKKARQLSECSISLHSQDLQTVIDHFKEKYSKLYLVGHSLGGPVILHTDLSDILKIVLWDPSAGMRSLEEKSCVYSKKLNKYLLRWGKEILLGQEMIDEWKKVSDLETEVKNITRPCKFVFAGNETKYQAWKPYLDQIIVPYEVSIIEGASHVFIEEGVEEQLFKQTEKWLK